MGSDYYVANDDVDRSDLTPGVIVRRYTDNVETRDDGTVVLDLAVPCCGRLARVQRRLLRHDNIVVACGFCTLVYAATLIDENDGGFGAELEVTDQVYVRTRKRSPTRPNRTSDATQQ